MFMLGQASCDPIGDDVTGCAVNAPIGAILGLPFLIIGLLAVIGGWFGWRSTKYFFWILAVGWLLFAMYFFSSDSSVGIFFYFPVVVYTILGLKWPARQSGIPITKIPPKN